MRKRANDVARIRDVCDRLLKKVEVGTQARSEFVTVLDLAWRHLHEWADVTPPSQDSTRGGSSSPVEAEDRLEEQRLHRQALRDLARVPELIREAMRAADELLLVASRYSVPIDHSKLPKEPLPGCVSCARPQDVRRPGTGLFSPMAEPDAWGAKRWGKNLSESVHAIALCEFCRDVSVANAQETGAAAVEPRHFPPLKAVELWVHQSRAAASRWLSRQKRGAA